MRILNFLRYRIRKFLMEEITLEDHVKRGMNIGKNCAIMDGSTFDFGHCNLITIGNNVTIAPQVYLLAHDASTKRDLGYTKIGLINIKDNTFIGARALIMPGVTIGENCIVGAGSVVTKSIPDNSVVVGNPARVVCTRDEYIVKYKKTLESAYVFGDEYTFRNGFIDEAKNIELVKKLKCGNGFIK